MEEKRIIPGLDFFKLIGAFLIVYLHTYNRDWGVTGNWFLHVIASIGVPFFFIVSGFFYGKGLHRTNFSLDYFKRYFHRILVMYIAWTLITLPVSWLCVDRGHPEFSLNLKIVYLFRMIFLSGSCGVYWYVLSLLYGSAIIYFLMKRRLGKLLFLTSIILFAVGVWYDSPYNNHNVLLQGIHVVLGSERNVINVGLFYMCIGYFFATREIKIKPLYLVLLFISFTVLRTYEIRLLHINSLQAILAIILFLYALNCHIRVSDENSIMMRKLSTVMYLVHYPFILIYDFYLRRGSIIDIPVAICVCLVAYFIITKGLPQKWQKVLIG